MKGVVFLLFAFCSINSAIAAEYFFDFNRNCKLAYKQIMALQNEQAQETLNTERKLNPNNLIPIYLADYADCLELLFNGDETKLAILKSQQDTRLDLLEKGDESSPWYHFCRANIQLHWALIHLRFGDNFKAATKFRKSFLLLKENKELHPNFDENNVLLGLEQAVAGAIPENYKWISNVFGIKGNVNNGVALLANYLNTHKDGGGAMQEEAMIYYSYLKFYLQSQQETAWRYINGAQYSEEGNLMRCFIKANLALNYRKAESAFLILKKAEKIDGYSQYPILNYELAEAMMTKLDPKCCNAYQLFLDNYKGAHFVKDALLKMSWMYYLQGNTQEATRLANSIKSKGNSATDADKQALRFAENPVWPMKGLLEIRLLIDGGLYSTALVKIQNIDKKQLGETQNVLEYNFRYGRIFEELHNHEKALLFYNATVQMGRDRKEYFAARAALHIGFIYERKAERDKAIAAFRDCLSMRHHDFQSSIDQLAKAGLNRLGN